MHLLEQYQNQKENIWTSYDLVYNRKKYNMDKTLATFTDQDLELSFNSSIQERVFEEER